jgi:hypothetical protein
MEKAPSIARRAARGMCARLPGSGNSTMRDGYVKCVCGRIFDLADKNNDGRDYTRCSYLISRKWTRVHANKELIRVYWRGFAVFI